MADTQAQHPKKDFNVITQAALKALALYQKHEALLKERIEEDMINGLVLDLDSLGVLVPGAETVREVAKAATAAQEEALRKGYEMVSALRTNLDRRRPPLDIRKAYGVGRKLSYKLVKDVKGTLEQIVARAEQNPDEAKSLGILPKDIANYKAHIKQIEEADKKQELLRAKAPTTTRERNLTARRILAAINAIIGAGVMEFAQDATTRSEFESLIGVGQPTPKTEEEKTAAKAERERKKAERERKKAERERKKAERERKKAEKIAAKAAKAAESADKKKAS